MSVVEARAQVCEVNRLEDQGFATRQDVARALDYLEAEVLRAAATVLHESAEGSGDQYDVGRRYAAQEMFAAADAIEKRNK